MNRRLVYSTAHIFSDTLRTELRSGGQVSMIAELSSAAKDRITFHPLVMDGPWLESPDPRWKDVAAWWCNEFYENVIECAQPFGRLQFSRLDHDATA